MNYSNIIFITFIGVFMWEFLLKMQKSDKRARYLMTLYNLFPTTFKHR